MAFLVIIVYYIKYIFGIMGLVCIKSVVAKYDFKVIHRK
ncbi:protein of unknown function [[Clostridium] ultunense Esp]|uniref:Uncharacterized protein n=1 Tax=[Clostridium] ultunense Esp TaxID=1288971 RepID=A0A1M4PSG6_9FIRM|nr:protein of unknown function [[Clostridium] ultunense Esp]